MNARFFIAEKAVLLYTLLDLKNKKLFKKELMRSERT